MLDFGEDRCRGDSNFIFDRVLIKFVGKESMHKISDKVDFGRISTIGTRVTHPKALHKLWKILCGR